jgi:hypothetical protein
MMRFDGTAARQLDLIDTHETPRVPKPSSDRPRPNFRLLKDDVYAELLRRRRRAQIAARHVIARED